MIYFIKDIVTQAIKIGYSGTPKKRLIGLQTTSPHELILLGTIQGGLEHETAYHDKFAQYKLRGEWFKADILPDILAIIANEANKPAKMNVIVSGDSRFSWGPLHELANRALVLQSLDEIHAKSPMAWIITGGEREIDRLAWQWAKEHQVEVYRYFPNWKKHGRFAGFKIGPQMLRSMFDPKLLLAFLSSTVSPNCDGMRKRYLAELPWLSILLPDKEVGYARVGCQGDHY